MLSNDPHIQQSIKNHFPSPVDLDLLQVAGPPDVALVEGAWVTCPEGKFAISFGVKRGNPQNSILDGHGLTGVVLFCGHGPTVASAYNPQLGSWQYRGRNCTGGFTAVSAKGTDYQVKIWRCGTW